MKREEETLIRREEGGRGGGMVFCFFLSHKLKQIGHTVISG
jgi:hypothetical protein